MQLRQYFRIVLLIWTVQLKWLILSHDTLFCPVIIFIDISVCISLCFSYYVAKNTFESSISCSTTLEESVFWIGFINMYLLINQIAESSNQGEWDDGVCDTC
jgi:hypothetical protein